MYMKNSELKVVNLCVITYFPMAAIISLKSPAVSNFTPHSRLARSSLFDEQDTLSGDQSTSLNSVLLLPRSLLIFKDEAYSD